MEIIKQIPENYIERKSGIENLNFLLKYSKVYVMDNHLAAGWCWLQELSIDEKCCFFHVDQHEDLCDGGPIEQYNYIRENPHLSIDDYTMPEYNNGMQQMKVVRWDTYIKQMQHISPSWFDQCYFACPDTVREIPPYTDLPLNIIYNASAFELYNNVEHWMNITEERFIFNLDLDYFFDSSGMRLFSDEYIKALASNINIAMDKIAVMTIALSPECCGGWSNAIYVFNLFAEEIDLIDENPFLKTPE